jgi:tetratricopeptide (TPR) repeat protein
MASISEQPGQSGLTRRTWHLPVFFLGVLILAGVLVARPFLQHGATGHRLERQLAEARRLLDKPESSLDQILSLIEPVQERADRFPELAAESHFLAGSAYLRQAERDGPAANEQLLREACVHLEQAEALGVADADRARLLYRLGKAWYLTNHDPQAILDHWKESVPGGADDPAEAYSMLSRAYVRLPNPDVASALDANSKLLQLPILTDSVLAPERLFRGELFLRLHQPDAARDILKKIGAQAPPSVIAQARLLRAGCCEEEEHWSEALALWKEVLDDKSSPPKQPDLVLYHLGLCHGKLDQPAQAAQVWEECLRTSPGDAGPAAALGLAGLRLLKDHNAQSALEGYQRAVKDVSGPSQWRNGLVSLARVREEFESGCHILRETGQYSSAMQLANFYEKLAPAGKAQEMRGGAARQWALARLDAVHKPGVAAADRAAGEEEARSLYRQAAEAFTKAAELAAAPNDQADRLWQGAQCFVEGQDPARAISVLERLLKLENPPERLGEGWFRLAEAQKALNNEDESQTAYKKCAEYPGRYACQARYAMADAAIAQGNLDQAEKLLEENLTPTNKEIDPQTKEKTYFALGNVHLQRRAFQNAVRRLEKALKNYPENPQANQARFQLAECFRLLADEAATNRDEAKLKESAVYYDKQYQSFLLEAANKYQELADVLSSQPNELPLTKGEQELMRVSAFASAQSRYYLGNYDESRRLYEGLAARYHHRIESLHALAGVAQCSWSKSDSEKAREALAALQAALNELPDKEFPMEPGAWDRKKWQAWINERSKPLPKP